METVVEQEILECLEDARERYAPRVDWRAPHAPVAHAVARPLTPLEKAS